MVPILIKNPKFTIAVIKKIAEVPDKNWRGLSEADYLRPQYLRRMLDVGLVIKQTLVALSYDQNAKKRDYEL